MAVGVRVRDASMSGLVQLQRERLAASAAEKVARPACTSTDCRLLPLKDSPAAARARAGRRACRLPTMTEGRPSQVSSPTTAPEPQVLPLAWLLGAVAMGLVGACAVAAARVLPGGPDQLAGAAGVLLGWVLQLLLGGPRAAPGLYLLLCEYCRASQPLHQHLCRNLPALHQP